MEGKLLKDLDIGEYVYSILHGHGTISNKLYSARVGNVIEVRHKNVPGYEDKIVQYMSDGRLDFGSKISVLFPHEVEVSITKSPEVVEVDVHVFVRNDGAVMARQSEYPEHELSHAGKVFKGILKFEK